MSRQPYWEEIKSIQVLMALFSCLPPNGKLREILEKALAISHTHALARTVPCEDLSTEGLRGWFNSLWAQGDLTPEMQELVDWQKNRDNMAAALRELLVVQDELGIRLAIEKKPDRQSVGT